MDTNDNSSAAPAEGWQAVDERAAFVEKLKELAEELDSHVHSGAKMTAAEHACMSVGGALHDLARASLAATPPAAVDKQAANPAELRAHARAIRIKDADCIKAAEALEWAALRIEGYEHQLACEHASFEDWYAKREQHDGGLISTYQHTKEGWQARAALATASTKPIAWVRFRSDGGFEGPIMDSDERMCDTRRKSGAWTPLVVATTGSTAYEYAQPGSVFFDGAEAYRQHVEATAPTMSEGAAASFQARVQPWMMECFGAEISADRMERNHRFFEEAGELVQACGMTREEAHALVDYTWGRPVGDPKQEVGGVMVTLAALCLANTLDMHLNAEQELYRISQPYTIDKIRAKQAAKPKHSPLPAHPASEPITDAARAFSNEEARRLYDEACLTVMQKKLPSLTFDGWCAAFIPALLAAIDRAGAKGGSDDA